MTSRTIATPATPKGRRTRETLLEAARRVFARDGFVGARMADIAVEAGGSLGALYRYFANKDDVFACLVEGTHERLFDASRAGGRSLRSEPFDALLAANLGYLREYYANRDVMRVLVEASTVSPRFRDLWWQMRDRHVERFLHAHEAAGSAPGPPAAERRAGAEAMACMVEQAAYVWYGREDLQETAVPIETAALVMTTAWHRLFFGDAAGAGLRSPRSTDV